VGMITEIMGAAGSSESRVSLNFSSTGRRVPTQMKGISLARSCCSLFALNPNSSVEGPRYSIRVILGSFN